MPDTATTTDQGTDTATVAEPTQPEATEDNNLGDAGKKALDAERRRAATAEREAKALKARLDEIEQSNMTELDKAKKAATEAQAQLQEYQLTALRQRVALEKGLPAELVDRLRGDNESDISADADALLALVSAPRSLRPDPTQGGTGSETRMTPEQQFAAFTSDL